MIRSRLILLVVVGAMVSSCCPTCWFVREKGFANTQLAYHQTFSDPMRIADFEFTDPDVWHIDDRGYNDFCLEFSGKGDYKPPVRSPHIMGLVSYQSYEFFILEAMLQQTGRDYGHRDMCLFFCVEDSSHFYYVHLATKADPHAHNIFIVDGADRTSIADTTTSGIDWGRDQWHKIRLVRYPDYRIEVFFDDMTTPVMTAKDDRLKAGRIGFGSFDDSGKVDNIKIHAATTPEALPLLFDQKE